MKVCEGRMYDVQMIYDRTFDVRCVTESIGILFHWDGLRRPRFLRRGHWRCLVRLAGQAGGVHWFGGLHRWWRKLGRAQRCKGLRISLWTCWPVYLVYFWCVGDSQSRNHRKVASAISTKEPCVGHRVSFLAQCPLWLPLELQKAVSLLGQLWFGLNLPSSKEAPLKLLQYPSQLRWLRPSRVDL